MFKISHFNNRCFLPVILVPLAFCLLLVLFPLNLSAQQDTVSSGETTLTTDEAIDLADAVLSVTGRLNSERSEQKKLRHRMSLKTVSADELKEIEESLSKKRTSINELEEDIDNLFTGIDADKLVEREDVDFDWSKDLKEMVFPLFTEMRSFTDRPREIERLKRRISFLENKRLKAIDKAAFTSSSLLEKLPDVYLLAKELKKQKLTERNTLASEIENLKSELLEKQKILSSVNQKTPDAGIPVASGAPATKVSSSGNPSEEATVSVAEAEIAVTTLRNEIEKEELKLVAIDGELNRIGERIKSAGMLKNLLQSETEQWKEQRSKTSDELTVYTHRLEELKTTKSPFFNTVHDVISVFFRSRGRNILIGILLAIAFAILFGKFHRWLLTLSIFKFEGQVPFLFRATDLLLHLASLIGTIMVFQFVLYFYDDWLLLAMSLLVIMALLWFGVKELPSMWQQMQLILNFGAVRDGERVVVDGIPWKVGKVNVFTKLHNPWLTGARIRVPLHELVNYRSRPAEKNEPWFPSKEGNWVMLSDGTFGKVALQTPEHVKLILYGGTQETYPISDYLAQMPKNLSTGFSVSTTFGVDYCLQSRVTKEIPEIMKTYLEKVLTDGGFMENTHDLKVEFKEAGASSLDIIILTTHNGDLASSYFSLHRLLQRGAVDCCSENNWGIPFPQLTVHRADNSKA